MARFVGKRLVTVSAGDAVRNADAVLNKALNSKVPVYRGGNAFRTSDWRGAGPRNVPPPDERHLLHDSLCGGGRRHDRPVAAFLAQMGLAQNIATC